MAGAELTLEEIKVVQLRLLNEFARQCESHGLRYYLAYGTLLGGVRHGGYIPWDDDVDVMMPRSDYREFCALAARGTWGASAAQFAVASYEIDRSWVLPYAKMHDPETRVVEFGLDSLYAYGVNIDIFPMDGHNSSRLWFQPRLVALRIILVLLTVKTVAPRAERSPSRRRTLAFCQAVTRLVRRRWLLQAANKFATETRSSYPYTSVLVGPAFWSAPTSCYEPSSHLQFEGQNFRVPADREQVLRQIYGDFRELPPRDKQVRHHTFKAYSK
jgi:lipopolysaccharide cholinephosphotransferase